MDSPSNRTQKEIARARSSLKLDAVSLQELNSYTEEKLAEDARAWGHPHSVLLKTKGFPTGITSRFRSRKSHTTFEGYHHGLLSCKTVGFGFMQFIFIPGIGKSDTGKSICSPTSLPNGILRRKFFSRVTSTPFIERPRTISKS